MVLIADVLIIAGFGFKISAVPFHMWAPDIYEGAPTPATAFFSVGSKAAGFAALIRVFMFGGLWQVDLSSLIVVVSVVAVLTMTYGNLVAAVQTNVKRLMAYSSIAQAGYIIVGFVARLAISEAGWQYCCVVLHSGVCCHKPRCLLWHYCSGESDRW